MTMPIELFQFQQSAASEMADRTIEYLADPVAVGRLKSRRTVPFYQALSSITGSGKTAILAQAMNEISAVSGTAPVVLWLSKGKVVVRQAYANLDTGGRYRHLLGNASVSLLADYDPADVEAAVVPSVFFATVGTFNNKDKANGSLRIFRAEVDTTQSTTWDALKLRKATDGSRRPLIVVYDEAQNLSDQQTDLLLELEPDAFLLASATLRFPARFSSEVIEPLLSNMSAGELTTTIPSSAVVESGLVKSTLSLLGINSPMEETISQMILEYESVVAEAEELGTSFTPKAIYVCNTNVVADDAQRLDDPKLPFAQRQAPPILIWRHLTENLGIKPADIAVYSDLRTHKDSPLPDGFNLFDGGDGDYESFTAGDFKHIIFNLALQEGWDDPACYFAYIDKSMESTVQITQVIGRVLRQPEAQHLSKPRLNTAQFYVRVDRNDTFKSVVDEVRKGLGGTAPAVQIVTTAPGKARPVELSPREELEVPKAAIDNSAAQHEVAKVIDALSDYSDSTTNTSAIGRRRIVQQEIGSTDAVDGEWEEIELQANQVSARWVFRREVSRRYRPAITVMNTDGPKFDVRVGFGSHAYTHIVDTAERAVSAYLDATVIKQQKPNPYRIGTTLARPDEIVPFENSLHEGYDGLNPLELEFAAALDTLGLPWARNLPKTGYGIPLITTGPTVMFYPDFLLWHGDTVLCLETKGEHLVDTDAGRKLLSIVPNERTTKRVSVRLISKGKRDGNNQPAGNDGYTLWSLSNGQKLKTAHHDDLGALVKALVA
jgi:type III restriction enzyme